MEHSITQYLLSIDSLIDTHLTGRDKDIAKKRLSAIQQKAQSSLLHLTVVGEFSSGKSTFINALLRKPLLKAACKATTASATYIKKGAYNFNLYVKFKNKKIQATETDFVILQKEVGKYHQSNSQPDNVYELLNCLTSEQSVANQVEDIQLQIPTNNLPNNVVIIDTPGINPGDESTENHFFITKNVVESIADLAIVLIPAHAAMSNTLENFLSTNLSRFLHRCIFVITAMDNEPKENRADIIAFAKQRLSKNLKIQNPVVFDESAITMLPVKNIPESKKQEWTYWQNRFVDFEKTLWTRLAQQKDTVIAEHLYYLIENILSDLKRDLQNSIKDLQKTKEIISNGKLSKIEQLTNRVKNSANTKIDNSIQLVVNVINDKSSYFTAISYNNTDSIINAGGFLGNFEQNEKPKITNTVQSKGKEYVDDVNKKFKETVDVLNGIIKEFEKEFRNHYSMFPLLKYNINISQIRVDTISLPYVSFSSSLNYIKQEEKKEQKKAGVWAVITGVAVTVFTGGLGAPAVIAALAAAGVAIGTGASQEEIQSSVKSRTHDDIYSYFYKIKEELKKKVNSQKEIMLKQIDDICNNHIKEYGAKIESLIKEQEAKEKTLENHIHTIKREIATLEAMEDEISLKRIELKFK